jgi:hypothetical protein
MSVKETTANWNIDLGMYILERVKIEEYRRHSSLAWPRCRIHHINVEICSKTIRGTVGKLAPRISLPIHQLLVACPKCSVSSAEISIPCAYLLSYISARGPADRTSILSSVPHPSYPVTVQARVLLQISLDFSLAQNKGRFTRLRI